LLHAAEAAYTGDFLEEDPYEDWATELREEARLTYVQVAIVLAMHTSDAGEHVTASRYCLRILERDQYNEPARAPRAGARVVGGRRARRGPPPLPDLRGPHGGDRHRATAVSGHPEPLTRGLHPWHA
jgi:hypothetical protein